MPLLATNRISKERMKKILTKGMRSLSTENAIHRIPTIVNAHLVLFIGMVNTFW